SCYPGNLVWDKDSEKLVEDDDTDEFPVSSLEHLNPSPRIARSLQRELYSSEQMFEKHSDKTVFL
ncbi:MAG: hypothetical protein II628_08365, partial [Lachnospiraceae bacterium]|nr:hypothetical protein [Lachnospiraceae bacterium]